MLIVIVGYACTGKTTLREALEQRGVLAVEASAFMIPLKQSCLGNTAQEVYEQYPKWTVSKLIEDTYGDLLDHAVLVGLRTVEELDYLKERHQVKLISLRSSLHTCYIRNNNRPHREHFSTEEEFYQKRILSDEALGLSALCAQAEEVILNDEIAENAYLEESCQRILQYLAS